MIRILSLLLLISITLGLTPTNIFAESDSGYFIVTAYYSPVLGQKYYLKGNYEAEKILNGEGIKGASGKPVFSGMLAAPKDYKFGTKIYLEGLGIGEVSDRGGAIINAGNRGYKHDRIDVWVGYGDEGLRRALYWGKREIKGYIVSDEIKTNLDYNKIPAPIWAIQNLKIIESFFNLGLGEGSDGKTVSELQKFLSKINLYDGEIDGVYNDKLINTIYDFQVNNEILKAGEYYGAGYWGVKTRSLMLKKYLAGDFDKIDDKEGMIVEKQNNNSFPLEEKKTNVNKIANKYLTIFNNTVETENDIKTLQEVLTNIGLYTGEINGNYKNIINIISEFQFKNNLISSYSDQASGYYGPKTRASLKTEYLLYLDKQEKIEEKKIKEEEQQQKAEKELVNLVKASENEAEKSIASLGVPNFGDVSPQVRELQLLLKQLGYFNEKDTAIYGTKTKDAILDFQIDKGLVRNKDDLGAGMIGPKTKASLKEELAKKLLSEKSKTKSFNKV